MQIADLRVLMRLPIPELDPHVGCNLTAAAMMMNLISGFSVWLFHTDEAQRIELLEAKSGFPKSGQRFKGFVKTYWPTLPPEPTNRGQVAERLYAVRNSLAHDLGVRDDPQQQEPRAVRLAKHSLSAQDIVEMELNLVHPLIVPVIEERGDDLIVHLTGVYWALHRMLRAALDDRPNLIEQHIAKIMLPEITEQTD
jgi:hypothetical protein